MSLRDYFSNNKIFTGTEKPTQGKFDVGDIIVNIGPNSAEEPMWICVEAGTPGVWELCSGVNEEEITNLIQSNALTAVEYTDGVDIQIDGGEIGNMNELQTTDKSSIVGAINELFQSANNGKELIANAIGEPLSSEQTFSAMSNDINDLLIRFKTNMVINGVSVESGDDFNSLINKLATLVSEDTKKIDINFVSELPDVGEDGKLYIISNDELNIVFSEQQPDSPEENTVYITYTTADNNDVFSYLVCKYGVFISIIGAQQLEDSELVDTQMYVYYNSEFIELKNKYRLIEKELDFITNCVKGATPGNYYEELGDYYNRYTYTTVTSPDSTFLDAGTYFSFSVRACSWSCYRYNSYNGSNVQYSTGVVESTCSVITDTAIDLTTVSKIKINTNVETNSTNYSIYIGVSSNNTTPTGTDSFVIYDTVYETGVTELDVNDLSGSYYLGVYIIEKSTKTLSMIIDSVLIEEI